MGGRRWLLPIYCSSQDPTSQLVTRGLLLASPSPVPFSPDAQGRGAVSGAGGTPGPVILSTGQGPEKWDCA